MYKIESERLDLFDVNMIITIRVVVSGYASNEKITQAFYNAVNTYEILNTKVIIDDFGNAFYKENDQHKNNITFCSKTVEELINEQEKIRFKIEQGEFLRCFADNEEQGKIKFTFMLHHLGGDGKSLIYFIETFLRNLNNEKVEKQYIKLVTEDTMPQDSKLSFIAKALANYYNKMWKKEKRVFTFDDMEEAYNKFWSNHKTKVETYTIESNELQSILKKCKEANIGYTSYDISNRIKDLTTEQDVGLAVDCRMDGNRTMSNQATGISVKYRYNGKKSVIENAKIINGLMKEKLANPKNKYFILHFMSAFDPTLVDAVNLQYAGAFNSKVSEKLAKLLGYGEKAKDLSVTNLTKIDIPLEYGTFKIEETVFIPPVVSHGKKIIGIVTANNKLEYTVHYYEN